jgi:hypothetical protein
MQPSPNAISGRMSTGGRHYVQHFAGDRKPQTKQRLEDEKNDAVGWPGFSTTFTVGYLQIMGTRRPMGVGYEFMLSHGNLPGY